MHFSFWVLEACAACSLAFNGSSTWCGHAQMARFGCALAHVSGSGLDWREGTYGCISSIFHGPLRWW